MNTVIKTPDQARVNLVAAVVAFKQIEKVACFRGPLPGTGQFIAVGTRDQILEMMGFASAEEAAKAAGDASTKDQADSKGEQTNG